MSGFPPAMLIYYRKLRFSSVAFLVLLASINFLSNIFDWSDSQCQLHSNWFKVIVLTYQWVSFLRVACFQRKLLYVFQRISPFSHVTLNTSLRKYILSYILLCLLIFLKRISNSRLKRILWITLFSSQGTNLAVVCVSTLTAEFLLYQLPLLCQLVVFRLLLKALVEIMRIELMTPCLQGRCSPSWAIPP